jgi:hypothetical protein
MLDPIDSFIKNKKDDSVYLTLEDGESKKVTRLLDIKPIMKTGFGGEEKEVLRFIIDVESEINGQKVTRTKNFDNGTTKFAQQVKEKGVKIGSSFIVTRHGTGTKTRYDISEVSNPPA